MQSQNLNPPKIAYSIREAVQVSSLSRSTLYNAISDGRLKARRVGGRRLVDAQSLHALITGEA